MNTPLVLTLYDKNDEVIKECTRSIVPWKILKKAVKLTKEIDLENIDGEADIDAIASLVVEVFGDQFTIEELDESADIGDMVAVLQSIIARANRVSLNPTPPAS